jgi:hypothetical protein
MAVVVSGLIAACTVWALPRRRGASNKDPGPPLPTLPTRRYGGAVLRMDGNWEMGRIQAAS